MRIEKIIKKRELKKKIRKKLIKRPIHTRRNLFLH